VLTARAGRAATEQAAAGGSGGLKPSPPENRGAA
jgi:hypothetical protein